MSSVCRLRMLVQHAMQNSMHVHQIDVNTAYLLAPIDCEIFVEQPNGNAKRGENVKNLFAN